MSNQQIIKNFQKIYEQQQQRAINSRQSTQFQNKAKINFRDNQKKIQLKNNFLDIFDGGQGIDPWNQNLYSSRQDIQGIQRLKEQSRKMKRTNLHIYHRNTNKSWSGSKEKKNNLRKQIQLTTPMFQPEALSQPNQKNLICYLRRKNEQRQMQRFNSEGNKLFNKHRKLLSRIYSHSCEGKMIINHISREQKAIHHEVSPIHRKIASSPQMFKDNHIKKQSQKDPKILFNISLNFKKLKQMNQSRQSTRKNKNSPSTTSKFFEEFTPRKGKKPLLQIL